MVLSRGQGDWGDGSRRLPAARREGRAVEGCPVVGWRAALHVGRRGEEVAQDAAERGRRQVAAAKRPDEGTHVQLAQAEEAVRQRRHRQLGPAVGRHVQPALEHLQLGEVGRERTQRGPLHRGRPPRPHLAKLGQQRRGGAAARLAPARGERAHESLAVVRVAKVHLERLQPRRLAQQRQRVRGLGRRVDALVPQKLLRVRLLRDDGEHGGRDLLAVQAQARQATEERQRLLQHIGCDAAVLITGGDVEGPHGRDAGEPLNEAHHVAGRDVHRAATAVAVLARTHRDVREKLGAPQHLAPRLAHRDRAGEPRLRGLDARENVDQALVRYLVEEPGALTRLTGGDGRAR
eukprot:3229832-Prymnesium_polylepis.1